MTNPKDAVAPTGPVTILCYSDEKILRSKSMTKTEVTSALYELWIELANLDKTNQAHCKDCEFSAICPHAQIQLRDFKFMISLMKINN